MKLLLVFVLLGCLSATWAHGRWNHKKHGGPGYNPHESEPESENSDENGDNSEEEGGDEQKSGWMKKEWWNKMLKNKTEPMLRLVNQTYHKMLALPAPDKDDSTNNWMERTQLVKEFVHEGKRILFGDHKGWHHGHHHHHDGGNGVDWYVVGELVAGILNRLDEQDDMKMVLGNKMDAKTLAEFYMKHASHTQDYGQHQPQYPPQGQHQHGHEHQRPNPHQHHHHQNQHGTQHQPHHGMSGAARRRTRLTTAD